MLKANSRNVGLGMLLVLFVVLGIFFVITWATGDPTDHLYEHQPQPTPPAKVHR